jgi:hypothetical protein
MRADLGQRRGVRQFTGYAPGRPQRDRRSTQKSTVAAATTPMSTVGRTPVT